MVGEQRLQIWCCELRQRRRLLDPPPIRPVEPHLTVGEELHTESLLVHRAVMLPAQLDQVFEPRLAAVGPVLDVVALAAARVAAGKAAGAVAVVEGAAQGGRDRPRAPADVEHVARNALPNTPDRHSAYDGNPAASAVGDELTTGL